jgi:hypothetical protein
MAIKYNHDKLERDLEESVRNSWQTKKIAQQNYEFLENQANISGEFFDLAMKEVKLGNRQLIDILSSETAFINAKSSAENAKTEYQLAVYQLLFSLGVLDENIFINKNSQDSIRNKKISNKNEENTNKILINLEKDKPKKNNKLNAVEKKATKLNKSKELMKTKSANLSTKPEVSVGSNTKNNNLNPTLITSDNLQSKFNNNKATPISLIEKDASIMMGITEVNKKEVKLEVVNNSLPKEKNIIVETKKEYRIQIGAFSKRANAKKFLDSMKNIDLKLAQFTIEKDSLKGLHKVLSINNFDKNMGKQICKSFKDIDINCILSAI